MVAVLTKPFKFKVIRPARPTLTLQRLPVEAKADEGFTGEVQGMPASDLEERFARALDRAGLQYAFRQVYGGARNQSGTTELDFMVFKGPTQYPIQIDGQFAHAGGEQKQEDLMKNAILDEALRGTNAQPVQRIPYTDLGTQEETNRLVQELF